MSRGEPLMEVIRSEWRWAVQPPQAPTAPVPDIQHVESSWPLEGQLHRELNVTRRAADGSDPAEVAVAGGSVSVRVTRIDDVERVEELAAHLHQLCCTWEFLL